MTIDYNEEIKGGELIGNIKKKAEKQLIKEKKFQDPKKIFEGYKKSKSSKIIKKK